MARSSSASPTKSSTVTSAKKQSPGTGPITVRIHIAPLTPETTASLIPVSVLDEAVRQSLSYHAVQTIPENSYAFLDLPKDQAEKLKRRLNGTVFRGVKVRVDEAKPETWLKHPEPEEPKIEYAEMFKKERKEERKEKRKEKRSKVDGEPKRKKRKKGEDGTLEGIELLDGRKVQRGWTKPVLPTATSAKYAGKVSPESAKNNDDSKRECLFKTPLPSSKTTSKEDKKDKDKKDKKKRKRGVVIKEFKNNTKFPQFLKVSQLDKVKAVDTIASEYVEGVGWVNAKGELVEEEKITKRAATITRVGVDAPESAQNHMNESKSAGSSENDKDDVTIDDFATTSTTGVVANGDGSKTEKLDTKAPSAVAADKSDASGEFSSDSDSGGSSSAGGSSPITPVTPILPVKPTPPTSPKTSSPTLQITIPTIPTGPIQVVHPLEALYKPTTRNTALLQVGVTAPPFSATAGSGTFKFGFDTGYDSEPESVEPVVQTPYRERYRSAAPTPDTAIGHHKFFPDDGEDLSGRLGFVPSTPKVVGGFPGGQGLFSRKDATPYTPTAESPLLFPHSESRFLAALSVWSKLPTPKTLTQTEEEPSGEAQVQKGKKGKGKAVEVSVAEEEKKAEVGEKTTADIWNEKFYENRGDWNRAWKGRRREAMKQKRKREAAGGPASAKRLAT